MFASLLLAAAALATAPIPAESQPEPAPREQPSKGLRPMGSTQPLPTSVRPSIGFLSAGSLRDRCDSSAPALVSYCFAYIAGVHDAVRAYETWLRFREFCPPFNGSQSDMRRAFVAYLKAHPESASGEAASVIVLAFKDQFPCTSPEQGPEQGPEQSKPDMKPGAKR